MEAAAPAAARTLPTYLSNRQITHWAKDATEETEALLPTLIAIEKNIRKGGSLADLRNLLDKEVAILVGEYPYRGVAEALAPRAHQPTRWDWPWGHKKQHPGTTGSRPTRAICTPKTRFRRLVLRNACVK